MLQQKSLRTYAPNSLFMRYIPQDTGSPGFDFNSFVDTHSNRRLDMDELAPETRKALRDASRVSFYSGNATRIDVEDTMLVGQGVIVRIEPDLASLEEKDAEAKIVSVTYAEKVLGNNTDAVEFVRCVKLLAGEDARGLDLQTIASHYYGEAKRRPVSDVLKEMALLAMELQSVTASEESRQFGDAVETDVPAAAGQMSTSDRLSFFFQRAAEVLNERAETAADIFHIEVRERSRYAQSGRTQGFSYDEEAAYFSNVRDMVEDGDEQALEAIMDSYVRVSEQYDEDHVVALHMSDGERVVVLGTLNDDVTEEYLPAEARPLAAALRRAYIGGEGAQCARKLIADLRFERAVMRAKRQYRRLGEAALADALADIPMVGPVETFSRAPLSEGEISDWMECATTRIYNRRVKRTARAYYTNVASKNRMGRVTGYDCHYTINVNPEGETRLYVQQVLETLLDQMKSDFHLRAQRSNSTYRDFHRRIRTARDTALVASTIKEAFQAKEEGRLSLSLFTALNTSAKLQRWALEAERVSQPCSHLLKEIEKSSKQKLMYLRWAMYGQNQPTHPIHSLPRQEKARVWDALKAATNMSMPVAA